MGRRMKLVGCHGAVGGEFGSSSRTVAAVLNGRICLQLRLLGVVVEKV